MALLSLGCSSPPNTALTTSCDFNDSIKIGSLYGRLSLTDSSTVEDFADAKRKAIVYYDADCSICHADLKEWKTFLNTTVRQNIQRPIVFVLGSADSMSLSHFVTKSLALSAPVFFDKGNAFFLKNFLGKDKQCHTVILDQNNQVVHVGSPLHNKEKTKLFLIALTEN